MSFATLNLYKENFKFSAAHFLIFDEQRAEKLHGHNYQVKVDLLLPPEGQFLGSGFHVDFRLFKDEVKKQMDLWDEHVLLPAQHPDIKVTIKGPSLELNFRERYYVIPKDEVVLLPITNTSVEQLSKLLAMQLHKLFQQQGILAVKVSVEETRGQSATFITGDQAF